MGYAPEKGQTFSTNCPQLGKKRIKNVKLARKGKEDGSQKIWE